MAMLVGRVSPLSRFACLRAFSTESKLPRVFFDITADGDSLGRVVMEVSVTVSLYHNIKKIAADDSIVTNPAPE